MKGRNRFWMLFREPHYTIITMEILVYLNFPGKEYSESVTPQHLRIWTNQAVFDFCRSAPFFHLLDSVTLPMRWDLDEVMHNAHPHRVFAWGLMQVRWTVACKWLSLMFIADFLQLPEASSPLHIQVELFSVQRLQTLVICMESTTNFVNIQFSLLLQFDHQNSSWGKEHIIIFFDWQYMSGK